MTKREAAGIYLADILPDVVDHEAAKGGRVQRRFRLATWRALVVALRDDGQVTDRQAATWQPPACIYVGPS